MSKILKTKSIYYNDVNLIAQPSVIKSRSEVPKELERIIVAPMSAVTGETFALEANKLGLSLCLHRFCKPEIQYDIFSKLPKKENVFLSVGLNDFDRVKYLSKQGFVKNILIDIANGYVPNLKETIYKIKSFFDLKKVMVGNIMTFSGYWNCICNDIDTYIRVGIAGGSACQTSDSTGYNRGQITELLEIKNGKNKLGNICGKKSFIVADGGIKNGNYASKAFGCGSDYVMMGGYFSRALEAETNLNGDGTYWGGASYKQQELYGGIKKHSEGKIIKIEGSLKPLSVLVNELWGGISSAVSYSGYKSLTDFIGNGVFEIKQNSLPPKER